MKTTIIQQVAEGGGNSSLSDNIQEILGWDEYSYYNFQFEVGIAYLAHYIPTDPDGQEMLIRSRIFWNWWKNHWQRRDERFKKICNPAKDSTELCRLIYTEMNDPATLAKAIYPTGVVLDMSYSEMIQQLFDNKIDAL